MESFLPNHNIVIKFPLSNDERESSVPPRQSKGYVIKHSSILAASIGVAALLSATTALAGEIKGLPPTGNLVGPPGTSISNGNGNSICFFSGLNDTPDGVGPPFPDPGGIVQSYGYFMARFGIFDPSNPDERASDSFPGTSCNPHKSGGLHG
jgi:hypothetical protein